MWEYYRSIHLQHSLSNYILVTFESEMFYVQIFLVYYSHFPK